MHTSEQKSRYAATRRRRYHEDSEFREKVLSRNRASYAKRKDDPEFQAKNRAKSREYYARKKAGN